jgi:hypothetical protein
MYHSIYSIQFISFLSIWKTEVRRESTSIELPWTESPNTTLRRAILCDDSSLKSMVRSVFKLRSLQSSSLSQEANCPLK